MLAHLLLMLASPWPVIVSFRLETAPLCMVMTFLSLVMTFFWLVMMFLWFDSVLSGWW